MGTKKKGILARSMEWAKHYRPFNKRLFWSKERSLTKKDINSRISNGD